MGNVHNARGPSCLAYLAQTFFKEHTHTWEDRLRSLALYHTHTHHTNTHALSLAHRVPTDAMRTDCSSRSVVWRAVCQHTHTPHTVHAHPTHSRYCLKQLTCTSCPDRDCSERDEQNEELTRDQQAKRKDKETEGWEKQDR